MFELKSISYEESRLEYFREQKARCERCLDYWVKALRNAIEDLEYCPSRGAKMDAGVT